MQIPTLRHEPASHYGWKCSHCPYEAVDPLYEECFRLLLLHQQTCPLEGPTYAEEEPDAQTRIAAALEHIGQTLDELVDRIKALTR